MNKDLLIQYREAAIENATDLLNEAKVLMKMKYYARSYFLSVVSIEETGKAFSAYIALGRNLNDYGVVKSLKDSFTDHASKITAGISCFLVKAISNGVNLEIPQIIECLKFAREKALYVDISNGGYVLLPKQTIPPQSARALIKLADNVLKTTAEQIRNNKPPKASSYNDKYFCLMTNSKGQIDKIFYNKDFWKYFSDKLKQGASKTEIQEYIIKYREEFACKNKNYSKN